MLDETRLAGAARGFEEVAFGQASWETAMEGFSEVLDLRFGQLVAFGRDGQVSLNITSGINPEAVTEMDLLNVHNPVVNSRVRVGLVAPELQFLDERNFTTEQDLSVSRDYRGWVERNDVGYSCVTPLLRQGETQVGLAAFRSRSQDEMTGEEKRAFMALAARARSAVNLAISFERGHAKSLSAGLECLSTAAFVCDPSGRIVSISPSAERALADGGFGRISDGMFIPYRPDERDRFGKSLGQALKARIGVDAHPPRPMALTARGGNRVILEFAPLPRDSGFIFTAAVMVIIRGSSAASQSADIARELFELTAAESRVASFLLAGLSPAKIALKTGISVGTVRNHVHRILSKSGCNSQVEFLALVSKFT